MRDDRVLAAYLVESSPDHYHVGIIFSRHLSRQEHDEIVATIRASNRPFKNLDKDSSRARKGIGTQFRAPFTWKHGVKAQCLKWFCKDEQQLIDRGVTLRPPGLRNHRRKSAFDSTIKDPTDRGVLLAWAIRRYPIEPHSRHVQQRALILSLLNRKIDIDIIRHIGPLWLLHFNNQATTPDTEQQNFRTEQSDAEVLFNDRLNRTLKDPDLQLGSKPAYDYLDTIDNYRITPAQLATMKRILQDSRKRRTELSSPLRNGDDNSQWASEVPLSQDAYFIEAIFVQLEINRLKDGLENRLRCTHQQLIEIIRRRHDTEICPRQFQRVKMRFCSLAREDRSYHQATKVELLVETQKGTPGLPSEYELADIVLARLVPVPWSSCCGGEGRIPDLADKGRVVQKLPALIRLCENPIRPQPPPHCRQCVGERHADLARPVDPADATARQVGRQGLDLSKPVRQ